jgi:7,8-dihydropterin-6-yl-methyl-4-(beta-D-ribofuranosyl)aminobenzene 5'-phosphate synthase
MYADPVKITILVDNYAADGLSAEHGLSLWIETGGKRLLFDTGQGGVLASNAEKLGIDLSKTDSMVLSHGHYDHSGGVFRVIRTARDMEVFCHPAAVLPRYGVRSGESKPLGMTGESQWGLESLVSWRNHWVQGGRVLSPGIGLTGYIPRQTAYEDTGGEFYLNPELSRPDPIDDDMALWILTQEGLVVCVGCSHAGLINTLNQALFQSGASKLKAVIGGFHLLNADESRITNTVRALQLLSPELIVPCHCTGPRAVEALVEAFGASVRAGSCGTSFAF